MDPRHKKRYLIVMGLCGVALLGNLLVPSNGAAVPAAARAAITKPIVTSADEALPLIPYLPFPRSVRTWDRSSDIRDIFLPPQLERNALDDGQSSVETLSRVDDETDRQSFESHHALHAVMVGGALRIAIVDGVWVREGAMFDGCKLERISNNQAMFSCPDGFATLVTGSPDLLFLEK